MGIRENLERVREKICFFCQKAGRKEEEIKIVAITKKVVVEKIEEVLESELSLLGENHLQEALPKILYFAHRGIQWHFVGQLQTNKVKRVVQNFQVIQSVDRMALVAKIVRELENLGWDDYPIFVQVNITGKEHQSGVAEKELFSFLEQIALFPRIRVVGFMTIGPQADESAVRRVFGRLRELRDMVNERRIFPHKIEELSMGMSDDFPWAILEGATLLRLGRVLFGERVK